jgi:ribonuclease BN (tRNA processing enzyme)
MRLTVLGASPACQNPGGACSGYLLEEDGTAVVIDCGSGVFGRLQQYAKPEDVQAVIIRICTPTTSST